MALSLSKAWTVTYSLLTEGIGYEPLLIRPVRGAALCDVGISAIGPCAPKLRIFIAQCA
ncbi:hypothetical protein [Xanthomonas campestris]|uniref:hypothetical protein n=1 Tax=Xanthomonas campestris TaxID=339 RepID=UPI00137ADA47|nr:hypothetical protein [Xanthomonas campestris]